MAHRHRQPSVETHSAHQIPHAEKSPFQLTQNSVECFTLTSGNYRAEFHRLHHKSELNPPSSALISRHLENSRALQLSEKGMDGAAASQQALSHCPPEQQQGSWTTHGHNTGTQFCPSEWQHAVVTRCQKLIEQQSEPAGLSAPSTGLLYCLSLLLLGCG